jgi:hypothetical protein
MEDWISALKAASSREYYEVSRGLPAWHMNTCHCNWHAVCFSKLLIISAYFHLPLLSSLFLFPFFLSSCFLTEVLYEGVSKSFRTGRLERELQIIQLSTTRCSCIAILWVSPVSFATIALCVASQWVFVVVYFVVTQSGNFWIRPRMYFSYVLYICYMPFSSHHPWFNHRNNNKNNNHNNNNNNMWNMHILRLLSM